MTNKAILNQMLKIQKQLNTLADNIDVNTVSREMLKSNIRFAANNLVKDNSQYLNK